MKLVRLSFMALCGIMTQATQCFDGLKPTQSMSGYPPNVEVKSNHFSINFDSTAVLVYGRVNMVDEKYPLVISVIVRSARTEAYKFRLDGVEITDQLMNRVSFAKAYWAADSVCQNPSSRGCEFEYKFDFDNEKDKRKPKRTVRFKGCHFYRNGVRFDLPELYFLYPA